jgi:hypothetical protein
VSVCDWINPPTAVPTPSALATTEYLAHEVVRAIVLGVPRYASPDLATPIFIVFAESALAYTEKANFLSEAGVPVTG